MNELKKKLSKIFYIQIALENYDDNIGNNNKTIENIYNEINGFRRIRQTLSEKEQLKLINDLLVKLNKILDEIGREKFTFYDDGSVQYIWKKELIKDKKTKQKEHEKNVSKILDIKQLIEAEEISLGIINPLSNKAHVEFEEFMNNYNNLNDEEKDFISNKILNIFNEAMNDMKI